MRTNSPQTETPEPGSQNEITYHTHRTSNGSTETCSVQIAKYIPKSAGGEDQKQLMLHQEEDKRVVESEDV